MSKIKKVSDYKEDDRAYLIEEGPGFFKIISAKVVEVRESKNNVRISLTGSSVPTRNWMLVEGNRIKALDASGVERLIYDNYDFAYELHTKKLRDYVPSTNVLKVSDDPDESKK